ncbi:hypothetical protein GLOIN_2v1780820 [Rhizophagus irregularis DAOM 181602=DAOM 197198]|uniref:Uncharacterized protein n=1 Tax=Rhizophagus irregularis (strain DAOM 181602 / DAOM 197198 / MUCL 43194) TaxID=747089 RepID=A0A2P4PLK0_RHIID|nr:hypothetical protein GLOIN_2v1780820 [Rhizophagus irregularis DAOM 181602=DAOM 197198]POG66237.1 hypothetical protein GLOIN_2v1780820 [Rhizophagus irregularis DAOM 181602=DAOM 197198]|eukprot:XP_025173103.1 hypothetical protein GLOIN_2v1780820 [Rhizophagus irregularis DAOM 181602=DAOM 197198]
MRTLVIDANSVRYLKTISKNTAASATIDSLLRDIVNSKEYVENFQKKYQFVKLTSLFLEITELLYVYNEKSSYTYKEVYKFDQNIHSCIKTFTGKGKKDKKDKKVSWEKNVKQVLNDENIFEEYELYRMNAIRMKCFVSKMLVEEYENQCYENQCYAVDDNNVENIAFVLIATIDSIMNDVDLDEITQELNQEPFYKSMDDFTLLLVKLKDLIGLSTGNGSPKSNTSSNNFSLPNSDEFSEVVQRLTLLLAREPRLCEQIWKSITEKKNVLSASDKKSNETKGRDSFKMLTEMVVHICFTANNMLPDEINATDRGYPTDPPSLYAT